MADTLEARPASSGPLGSDTISVRVAASPIRRLVGLLGRRSLRPGEGLLIRPCSSVHTFGMRFPIDVVYLDREGTVVKVVDNLRPWRFSLGGRRAYAALELVVGDAARAHATLGSAIVLP